MEAVKSDQIIQTTNENCYQTTRIRSANVSDARFFGDLKMKISSMKSDFCSFSRLRIFTYLSLKFEKLLIIDDLQYKYR